MKPRVLILALAAIAIFAAVEYRLRMPVEPKPAGETSARSPLRPAPPLEGTDSNNKYFRLQRYLGRHEVFVVFFDRKTGADNDPVLAELKKHTATLKSKGIFVVAVSSALPQENRKAAFETPIPFVLVTDPDQVWKFHRPWGCLNEDTGEVIPRAFHIDRAGKIASRAGSLQTVTLAELIAKVQTE
ncbi:MAG: redoxin domain-containing protein [Planctomycetes bacterium]|nr:redoxin domain-containing protein [Planctomycetota bacterium]